MRPTIAVCIFLAATLNAGSAAPVPDALSPFFNIDDELHKISKSCLTTKDLEQLAGNQFKWEIADYYYYDDLIPEAISLIGIQELRAALGFSPPGNFTKFKPDPTEEELKAAKTVEEYFNLKEPQSENRSLDSKKFFEHNFPPVIANIDKRFPAIRQIFRRKFLEVLHNNQGSSIDKKIVDKMIESYQYAQRRVNRSMRSMRLRIYLCELEKLNEKYDSSSK